MSSKIPDVFDNCPAIPNADQTDADGDGTGDLCDVPSVVTAHLDIKPGSCPNPFNLKLYDFLDDGKPTKGGVLPVAILGSASFDVAEIDITTLSLEGVAPRQKGGGPKFEDVATPFVGAECSCTDAGPDGITDLMMHFSSQEVAAAVPIGVGGEKRALTLTGQLLDGTSFEASDCVTFVGHSSAAK
ncbi:MAG: hypothetical protein OEN01_11760, partial [Candidatus Krumholzibacteria bacterium]|nr:hypothetical protein [Candidatus Krumholzibacteria bacterium]